MINNNNDFLNNITLLLKNIVEHNNIDKLSFREIEKLYTGSAVGGKVTPLMAINNLKQSYTILNAPYNRNIALIFKDCIEYAERELNNYSLFLCGRDVPVIMFPIFVR